MKPHRAIKDKVYLLWVILLPTPTDCEAMSSRNLISKDLILRTEREGRRGGISIMKVPPQIVDELLPAYAAQFGQLLAASSGDLTGVSKIMIDRQAVTSIPNCLDVGGLKIPVIMTGCKPTCWNCGETGNLSSSCPEIKASRDLHPLPTQIPFRLACNCHASDQNWCDKTSS